MSSSSTCTLLSSCLGFSDNNLKVLTSAAGRRWFQIMRTANIHISKLEHNKEWYHMLGSEEESIRLSIKQQISGKVSKPSWVQNIPSVRADQPPLFNIEEEEECPQILPTKRRKIEKLNKCDGEWYPLPPQFTAVVRADQKKQDNKMKEQASDILNIRHDASIEASKMAAEIGKLREQIDLSRSTVDRLEKKIADDAVLVEIGTKLKAVIKEKCWPGTEYGYRMYGMAWAQAPKLSSDAISQLTPIVVAAFLGDAGLADIINLDEVQDATPCPNLFKKILRVGRELVNQAVAKALDEGAHASMSHDKGERSKMGRLVRDISLFDKDNKLVQTIPVDCDGTNGTDSDVAGAINKTLKEKLQSLVPEGTTEIELMHPDNVALGPLEI